ncbi:DUF2059 domain-containing protein [Flavobacteriaceae bacterium]|nr:DUF2059 domain-containing protein [Flavobacteriaceae bacterium]
MSKVYFILVLLGLSFQGYTQENDASKLVALLHQQDLGFRLELLQQYQPSESSEKLKDSTAMAQALYTKIEAVYQKQFTVRELKELYAFYTSPLGEKLLEEQGQLNSEISTVTYNWELEQQGISVEDFETPNFDETNDEPIDLAVAAEDANPVEVAKPLNIASLDDLKALVRKDPFMISDQNVLIALFGQKGLEDLFEQQFEALEAVRETDSIKH